MDACSGLSAGIYTTSSPEACFHVLDDCKANIAVVENQTQLDKILQVRLPLIDLSIASVAYNYMALHRYEIGFHT